MTRLRIETLCAADDAAACRLERACVQGGSLAVRFSRPSFAARSEVYNYAVILGAWVQDELVGTVAAAQKNVSMDGESLSAAYFYDLRIHPQHRGRGYARELMCEVVDRVGEPDCLYILVAGQNERMLSLVDGHFCYASERALALTYMCLPTFRRRRSDGFEWAEPSVIREEYLRAARPAFVPDYDACRYHGHVASVRVDGAGCSIWSNEQMMAEEVVRVPAGLRALRVCGRLLAPVAPVPSVPMPGSAIRSWFLYDVYAHSEPAMVRLLGAVNNLALGADRTVIYLLLPTEDGRAAWIRRYQRVRFSFPYRMLMRGRTVPAAGANVYIDVRDL